MGSGLGYLHLSVTLTELTGAGRGQSWSPAEAAEKGGSSGQASGDILYSFQGFLLGFDESLAKNELWT